MFNKLFFCLLFTLCSQCNAANELEGNWRITDSLGSLQFIVNISKTKDGSFSAKVVENKSQVSWCVRCKGHNQNKSVKDISILSGLKPVSGNPRVYKQGTLVDVKSGNEYPVNVKVRHGNILIKGIKNKEIKQLWTPVK